jgi:hypothetical protein
MNWITTWGGRRTVRGRLTVGLVAAVALVLSAPVAAAGAAPAPVWRVEATATEPGPQDVGLNGISCLSQSDCMAVGSAGSHGFSESWDGHAWGRVVDVRVAGARTVTLYGVACPAVDNCFAVGVASFKGGDKALVEHWNGSGWSASATAPTDPDGIQLSAVACAGPSACMAVGSATTSTGEKALIERWNGTTWTVTPAAPTTSGDVFLLGVSCPTAGSCTAVGVKGTGTNSLPLVEHWNGTAWLAQSAPAANPTAHTNSFDSVSCTSPTACTAVGQWSPSSAATGTQPLVERYNGRTWQRQPVPVRPAAAETAGFNAVTCPSSTNCTAVGSFGPNGAFKTFAAQWNGSTWTEQTTGNLGVASTLASVSCTAGVCRAAGLVLSGPVAGTERSRPLVEVR